MIHGLVAEKVAASIGEPSGWADKRQKKTGRRFNFFLDSILTSSPFKKWVKEKDERRKSKKPAMKAAPAPEPTPVSKPARVSKPASKQVVKKTGVQKPAKTTRTKRT